MKPLGIVRFLALTLVVVVGLGALWWSGSHPSQRAADAQTVLALSERLAAGESGIREQVLRLRHGLHANFDPLANLVLRNRDLLRQAPALSEDGEMRQAIEDYRQTQQTMARVVEDFKNRNAIIRNSLRYFQYDVFRSMASLPHSAAGQAMRQDLMRLANVVLRRGLGGQAVETADAGTGMEQLNVLTASLEAQLPRMPVVIRPELLRQIQHAKLIQAHLPRLDQSSRTLLAPTSQVQLQRITRLAHAHLLDEANAASRFRHWLGLLSVLLLLTLGGVGLRLGDSLRQVARQRRFLMALTDNAGAGVMAVDGDDNIVFANPHAARLLGYERDALLGMRLHGGIHVHPDGRPMSRMECPVMAQAREGKSHASEGIFRRADGVKITVMLNSGVLGEEEGNQVVLVFQDISERKRHVRELSLAERIFENSQQGVVITDAEGNIERVNPAYCQITGYTAEELIGANPRLLKSGQQPDDFYAGMWHELKVGGSWRGEMRNRRKNGDVYVQWSHIDTVRTPDGGLHYAGIVSDITEIHDNRERLATLAYYDTLTGLPNRALFRDRLSQAMIQARREGKSLALLFADLDNFKGINDSLGHAAGDELLGEMARRLKGCVRESDTVARLGGDEFAILLLDAGSSVDVARLARAVIEQVRQPAHILDYEVVSSTSVGITLYPQDADTAEKLLRNADVAMYRAKEQGKDSFQFYTSDMASCALEAMRVETALRRALDADEFSLHYQPQYRLDGQPVGVEALLRWHSETLGQVSPAVFIPVAEKCGLIGAIGNWVLREACQQCQRWREGVAADMRVAVNLSVLQFRQPDLTEKVAEALTVSGLPGGALELEITESVVMEDVARGLTVLSELKALGCTVAIDDFGTGYSSLSYLKRLPVDMLKIDKSFIDGLGTDPHDTAVAQAIVGLARSLDLDIVAEGVETEGQWRALNQLKGDGCILAQGYYLSRPLPAGSVEQYLVAMRIPAAA